MGPAGVHGRRSELEAVHVAAQLAGTGRAQLVTLVGVAGIGKSALLEEVTRDLAASGMRVHRVALSEAEMPLTWAGLHLLCGDFADHESSCLSPGLRDVIPGALGRRKDALLDGGQVAFALAELISLRAGVGPVAIVVDDLHWLDQATAGALAFAIRASVALPVLVLLSFRPDHPLPIDPGRLLPLGQQHEVLLGGLSPAAVYRLLAERCAVELGRADLIRIHDVTGGVPLHVIEIGRLIAAGAPVRDALVPASVQAMIGVRLAELQDDVALVLQLAALLARPSPALIREALDLLGADADIEVERALADAEASRFARWRGEQVEFEHPLVRAAIVEAMPAGRRTRLERVLAGIVADPDERALLLAHATHEPDAALADALEAAADRAAAHGAPHLVAERLQLAVAATPEVHRETRARRLLRAAVAADDAGDRTLPLQLLDRADALVDDPTEQLEIGLARVLALGRRGDLAAAGELAARLLDGVGNSSPMRWRLHDLLAQIATFSDLDVACDHATAALEHVDPGHESHLRVRMLRDRLALLAGRTVDLSAAASLGADVDAQVLAHAADILLWGHRLDDALAMAQAALDTARRRGDVHRLMTAEDTLADTHAHLGNWELALDHFQRFFDLQATVGGIDTSSRSCDVAAILASQGEVAAARRMVDEASAAPGRYPTEEIHLHHQACHVMVCLGDWASAATHGRVARQVAARIGYRDLGAAPFRADLVEALLHLGETAEAGDVAEEHHVLAQRSGLARGRADAARSRALVAAAGGDADRAIALLEHAAGLHGEAGVPLERGRDLLLLGATLRQSGRRARAGEQLDGAAAVFERLGARTWMERTDAERARLGARRIADRQTLTPTEEQIARLAAQGRTNVEIADALSVSVRTVESNLTRVYRKVGVRSRTELAAALARQSEPG